MSDFSRGPISMIRATSMLLRYGLDEPAAADLIEQAMERSLEVIRSAQIHALIITFEYHRKTLQAFSKNLVSR